MAATVALPGTALMRVRVKPRILAIHNYYQQPGGEDAVFAAETALLETHGHAVTRLTVHNDELKRRRRLGVALDTLWNRRQCERIDAVIRGDRPDVLHCHNTFPQFSPAVYHAAKRHGVAVVQTLHNFRLACVNGLLFRDGHPCTQCVGSFAPWAGVRHACYRASTLGSLTAASMVAAHKAIGTYDHKVDRYIALTSFAREQFVRSGLREEAIAVKPNFAPDRGTPATDSGDAFGFLYVGRLSTEKGILPLIEAARRMRSSATVTIVGDGPLRDAVEQAARDIERVSFTGPLPSEAVHQRMRAARAVVIPSICFENFPVVAAEAYGAGRPVVASAHGGLTSIVADGETGVLVPPDDPGALAAALDSLEGSRTTATRMGRAARSHYETSLSPAANYAQLAGIYDDAIAAAKDRASV